MAPFRCQPCESSSLETRNRSSKINEWIPLIVACAFAGVIIIGFCIFMCWWMLRGGRQAYVREFELQPVRGRAPRASAIQPASEGSSPPARKEESEPKGQDSALPTCEEKSGLKPVKEGAAPARKE